VIQRALAWLAVIVATAIYDVRGEGFVHIRSETMAYDWVMDPSSGRLFAAVGAKSKPGAVVEYDSANGKELRRFPVGPRPYQMLIKGGTLVVSIRQGTALEFIDLKANKHTGRLRIDEEFPRTLFASQADNGIVFAICGEGDSTWEDKLFKVDLKTQKVVSNSPLDDWDDFAISRDGKSLVTHDSWHLSLNELDEDSVSIKTIRKFEIRRSGRLRAGPGYLWIAGGNVWPHGISVGKPVKRKPFEDEPEPRNEGAFQPMQSFPTPLLAVHQNRDLALGLKTDKYFRDLGEELVVKVFSFSTGKEIGQISLGKPGEDSDDFTPDRDYNSKIHPDATDLKIDSSRELALLDRGNDAYIIDLKKLDVEVGPMVLLDLPSSHSTKVGTPVRIPLRLTDGKLGSSATFALSSRPAGGKIDGTDFVWTPSADEIGQQQVTVSATVGGVTATANIGLIVEAPSVEFDSEISSFQMNPKGNQALVVQTTTDEKETISVVDLEAQKVLIKKDLEHKLTSYAWIGDKIICAFSNSGESKNWVEILDPESLSTVADKSYADPIRSLLATPQGWVAIRSKEGDLIVDGDLEEVPGFESINQYFIVTKLGQKNTYSYGRLVSKSPPRSRTDRVAPVYAPLNGGFRIGNFVTDPASGEVLWNVPHAQDRNGVYPTCWGRSVSNGILWGLNRKQIYSGQDMIALPGIPATAYTVRKLRRESGSTELDLSLVVRDLDGLKQLDPIRLIKGGSADQESEEWDDFRYDNRITSVRKPRLQASESRVCLAEGERLFTVDLRPDDLAKFSAPLHFRDDVQIPEVDIDGAATTFKLKTEGGGGEVNYRLFEPVDGVTIDAQSGEVTVDGKSIWTKARPLFEAAKPSGFRISAGGVWLNLSIVAKDEEGASDYFPVALRMALPDRFAAIARAVEIITYHGGLDSEALNKSMSDAETKIAELIAATDGFGSQVESLHSARSEPGAEPEEKVEPEVPAQAEQRKGGNLMLGLLGCVLVGAVGVVLGKRSG